MAKQQVALELFYDGAWNDLVTPAVDVMADSIVITRGDGADSAAFRPAQIDARLNNDDDRYRISNPNSPLYGKVGLATPMRVSVSGQVRGYVEASTWKAGETNDFVPGSGRGLAWVDVSGGGLLQRVGQWTAPVKSPLRRQTEGLAGLIGYWSLEDKAGTVYGSPLIPGTYSTFMGGHSFGSQNSPPGGGTAVDKALGGDFPGFRVAPGGDPNGTAGWQHNKVIFLGQLDTSVGSGNNIAFVDLLNGSTVNLYTTPSAGTTTLTVSDGAGTIVATSSPSTAGYQWTGRWIMVHVEAVYSAGTTTVTAYWRAVGSGYSSFGVSYSGVPSDVFSVDSDIAGGSSFGHMAVVKGFASSLRSANRATAFESYPKEIALTRAGRLLDENNVPYYVSANWAKSAPMGPQGIDSLAKQLLEIRDTEDALIFDVRAEGRIWITARADRLNQSAKLVLDAAPGQSPMPGRPTEVTDDVPVHNIVTASQRGGGDFTAEDDTSSMGTAPPPAGRGEYRQTVNVNLGSPDADLPQVAYWYLGRGTVAKPAYPTVTVDLTGLGGTNLNPTFEQNIADWTGFGGSITQTNFLPHDGLFCMKLVPDGVSATSRTECGSVTGAAPGQSWRGDAWVKNDVSRNVQPNINWFGASGFLGTTNGAVTPLTAFTWRQIAVVGTAPAGATSASLSIDMVGTPPASNQLYIDQAIIRRTLIYDIENVDIGDVLQIINYREYTIRLFVLGYVETINTHTRQIVFTCADDQQFNVSTIGTGRLAARTTTLNAAITTTATTIVTKTSDPLEQFRTGSNSVPVLIDGELITLGTVGAVTGTGPFTQTITGCTRSVNGIVKAHLINAPVLVQNPIIAVRRN